MQKCSSGHHHLQRHVFFSRAPPGCRPARVRAVGITAPEFPTAYASDADDYLAKGLAAPRSLAQSPLIRFVLPRMPLYGFGQDL